MSRSITLQLRALVVGRTVSKNNLWSAFDVDAYDVVHFWVVDRDDRAFEFAVEGNLRVDAALLLRHHVVYGDLRVLQPLDQTDLCTIADGNVEGVLSHLDVCLGVKHNAFDDLVNGLIVKLTIQ